MRYNRCDMSDENNIKTLSMGCRLNALEAEKIKRMIAPRLKCGIVVNTCAVTGEAERQSGQAVRKIARDNPNVPIFVTGCGATHNPGIFDKIPNTFIVHNRDKLNPAVYINIINNYVCNSDSACHINMTHHDSELSKQFVQVQNGCNHKCTYCITRILRGPAVSFPYTEILADVRNAVANGFGEIVLTGVDTASYAHDGMLISDVCANLLRDVPEIRRLRISSFDPASPQIYKIIDMMKSDARMMPHMHLSMQSGSDTILRAMQRRHNAQSVRNIVAYAGPGITFSWDIICGFPGETDDLFRETLDLVRDARPIKIHAFPFSARPGTVAFDMPNKIPHAMAKERVHQISAIADAFRNDFMRLQVGQSVPVLVEKNNIARTPHDIDVKIDGAPIAPRTICNVKLVDVCDGRYVGMPVQ